MRWSGLNRLSDRSQDGLTQLNGDKSVNFGFRPPVLNRPGSSPRQQRGQTDRPSPRSQAVPGGGSAGSSSSLAAQKVADRCIYLLDAARRRSLRGTSPSLAHGAARCCRALVGTAVPRDRLVEPGATGVVWTWARAPSARGADFVPG